MYFFKLNIYIFIVLKVLTMLEIMIPTHLLFSFFEEGVNTMKGMSEAKKEDKNGTDYRNICMYTNIFYCVCSAGLELALAVSSLCIHCGM